ncbi:MAG: cyclic nucleotide-binding domain-containing protein, partial [Alphaproteobacteria bacterium]
MTDENDETLEHIAVLGDLPAHVRRALEKQCRWREVPAQEQIVDPLNDSRDVYFVVRGEVRVVNYSYSGREIRYADIPAGGFFGELAAIDGAPRSANVVALIDT